MASEIPDTKTYLNEKGEACPYCGSKQKEGHVPLIGVGVIEQLIRCGGCKKEWTDVYKLHNIEFPRKEKRAGK